MRLGLSQVSRKLRKRFNIEYGNEDCKRNVLYFLDDEDKLVAKEIEGQILQFFAETEEKEVKLLVLVKGLKRKVDQNLSIISAALVFNYEEGKFIRLVKSRSFCYERDVNLEDNEIRPIAQLFSDEKGLIVASDLLGVTERFKDVDYLENTHPFFVISEKPKKSKTEKKD